jgi:hypothetical protein
VSIRWPLFLMEGRWRATTTFGGSSVFDESTARSGKTSGGGWKMGVGVASVWNVPSAQRSIGSGPRLNVSKAPRRVERNPAALRG